MFYESNLFLAVKKGHEHFDRVNLYRTVFFRHASNYKFVNLRICLLVNIGR